MLFQPGILAVGCVPNKMGIYPSRIMPLIQNVSYCTLVASSLTIYNTSTDQSSKLQQTFGPPFLGKYEAGLTTDEIFLTCSALA